ncbi:hypothetical protein PM10SUCC1_28550 [Propionigenium maris DSM 9537]|uniref:Uncharacterized protein n=1 Tax=Propionigenium maris DSM 9537 TaxID=1123000 RepID=A0A9W6GP26_9FUSO|nr:hypothetical protein [Propionigenium maris]GLI57341.1 hypothetical protein PM10SUCC1_28550 [Propionigenium maris DSM 9537]
MGGNIILLEILLCLILYAFYLVTITGIKIKGVKRLCSLLKKSDLDKEFLKIILKSIVSLDWVSAHLGKIYLKGEFKRKKLERKLARYIKKRNCINLAISIVMFFLANLPVKIISLNYVLYLLIYRCISRSFELIFAFGKDVVEPKKYILKNARYETESGEIEVREEKIRKKSSSLKSHERIKLAINSYIELNLNFAVLYHLLNLEVSKGFLKELSSFKKGIAYNFFRDIFKGDFLLYDLHTQSIETLSIMESLYKSIGISTASGIGSSELGFFSALQSITVIVLVIFAIATYLGSDD